MKITVPVLALALQAAASSSVERRDPGELTGMMTSVLTALQSADAQVLAYGGGPPQALRKAAHNLYQTIKDQTVKAHELGNISVVDTMAIAGVSQQVTQVGTQFVKDLGDTKWAFEVAGLCTFLFQYTSHLADAVNEFFSTVGGKFPVNVQAEAAKHIAETQALFVGAENDLAPGVCVNKVEPPQMPGGPGGKGNDGKAVESNPSKTTGAVWYTPTAGSNGTYHGGKPSQIPIAGAAAVGASSGLLAMAGIAVLLM
ncbi:hypothetical protein F5Y15DRAFT_428675 [Xylariaceae sp. FL0016]|nr:hypothetical protein F5Y15DRAFT_428675 [Xylariaceae sp. FL0016]